MHKILIAAAAFSLLGASTALAQPDHHDQQGGYHDNGGGDQNRGDRGNGDHQRGGGWQGDGGRHHRDHRVCTWRHHHQVCYRQHW